MTVGLICGLLAALCYGAGSVFQASAAQGTHAGSGLDAKVLARLISQWPYLVGLGLDGAGFLLGLVAIQFLPLFLAESMFASSVGVTAVLAVIFLKVKLSGREKFALGGLMVGLMLLAISARPEQAPPIAEAGGWILLGLSLLCLPVAWLATKTGKYQGAALAAVSGLAYSGLGISARVFVVPSPWWHAISNPLLYAIVIFGIIGTVLFASALQRETVTTVTALVFGIETTLPALVGLVFLGDQARHGFAAVALFGFVVALMSSITLAGQSEPEAHHEEPEPVTGA